ncbi:LON peptidase substrate-binding domain-containing protein [Deinococcus maricopensis]|uniref:Peptidase S16 lon domain protein n=1 Tax=Deinococcus maricopensis (strain DSM 21211 / LMG 22137 / NRRL B-23946 / LB-34) TaxID=709986 RepID=E8UAE6_DEIML|nr:LON peptidase substrate-binding domain-containing protein [Deinococcus maricopensis]ADV68035.1 peptidase S16 lon domain protein [Deinococcus maricopensis DSM 21211]
MSVPLFPLPNLVLLPGLVVPLYIFEPRYRALLARVQASGEPFGIVRIEVPRDASDRPVTERIARVGTLAYVREVVTHEDGTSSITVVGGERFRTVGYDESHSYLSAAVEVWPLEASPEPGVVLALAERVRVGVLAARSAEAAQAQAVMPEDAVLLASYAAAVLPLSGAERQAVLEASSLVDRLSLLVASLPPHVRTLN